MTNINSGHVTGVTSGHVTDVTSGSSTASLHRKCDLSCTHILLKGKMRMREVLQYSYLYFVSDMIRIVYLKGFIITEEFIVKYKQQ